MTERRRDWLRAVLLTALISLIYIPSLRGTTLLDDDFLTHSRIIRASDGLSRIWLTTEPADYWPLTNSIHWIEWRLCGGSLTGYHVVNLLLHVVNAILIWKLLERLTIPGGYLAALLYAVHPVNVESVAWVAQLKGLLALLFFLLSILTYLGAHSAPPDTARRFSVRPIALQRWPWYLLSLFLFVLAMLSKGSVAILPLVLLLIVWWRSGSITFLDVRRTAPFLVVAIVLTCVNIWFQHHGTAYVVRDVTFRQRLLGAAAATWFYLSKAYWPLDLCFVYPQWNVDPADFRWWLPLLATIAVTVSLLRMRHVSWVRPILFAWACFNVSLLPVMGFTDVGYMKHSLVADHYQQISVISAMALAAAGWLQFLNRAPSFARPAAPALATGAIVLLTMLSWNQSCLYRDATTLYQAALERNPNSPLLHYNIGCELAAQSRREKAQEHFQEAIRLDPNYAAAHNNFGALLRLAGDRVHAVAEFKKAIEFSPKYPDPYRNLGVLLFETGQTDEAVLRLKSAVELNPQDTVALNDLGFIFASADKIQEAIGYFERAVEVDPDDLKARLNLGNALLAAGRAKEAIHYLEPLVLRQPADPQECASLAAAYAQCNRPSDAVAAAQRAIHLARSQGNRALAEEIQIWLAELPERDTSKK
jgi:tetratricopeptide (TPR) repeat protein